MNELNEIAKWIYGRLTSNAFITDYVGVHPEKQVPQIYEDKAPNGAQFPYLTFKTAYTRNHLGAEGRKIFVEVEYDILLHFEGFDFSEAEIPSNQIMIQLGSSQVDGVWDSDYVQGCIELRPVQGSDVADGTNYMYIGSRVAVMCRAQG